VLQVVNELVLLHKNLLKLEAQFLEFLHAAYLWVRRMKNGKRNIEWNALGQKNWVE
jgi:hypothetical protein